MCQVHTGAYVSLLAPGKTDYTACYQRKTTYDKLYSTRVSTNLARFRQVGMCSMHVVRDDLQNLLITPFVLVLWRQPHSVARVNRRKIIF